VETDSFSPCPTYLEYVSASEKEVESRPLVVLKVSTKIRSSSRQPQDYFMPEDDSPAQGGTNVIESRRQQI
jgi:hypothetical protein